MGGSALLVLGLVPRTTRDVDIVALREGDRLLSPTPLPDAVVNASQRVARDFALPLDWLNTGPSDLLEFGLPRGFLSRVESRRYGPALTVHFASRLDQVHLKLYAAADHRSSKHEADLKLLEPTRDELVVAARWTREHDPSEGFKQELQRTLAHFGVADVDLDH